jgi:hypothetical protein
MPTLVSFDGQAMIIALEARRSTLDLDCNALALEG